MADVSTMTVREIALALRACVPVHKATGYGGFYEVCREHGSIVSGVEGVCGHAEKLLSDIFDTLRREGGVAALLREARLIDQSCPTDDEAELADNLRQSAAQSADPSHPAVRWTDKDMENSRLAGLRTGWARGVRDALDRAVRNDDGITLRLDEKNPY